MTRCFLGRLVIGVISKKIAPSALNVFEIMVLAYHTLLNTAAFIILLVGIERLHVSVNVLRLLLLSQQVHIWTCHITSL